MAKLNTLPLSNPGALGLNTQQASITQPLGWLTVAENLRYNENGAPSSRKGYKHLHPTSVAEEVIRTHTYIDGAGNTLNIFSTPTKLYKIVGTTVTDITGTATTPTAGYWKFQNFNGRCVAWQDNHTPITLATVGGTFSDLTGTAIPSGNECLSAFGRIWVIDGDTLKWSDLLIYNDFSGGSAGSADLSIYWPQQDEGVGLAEHNGFLLVFGKDSFVILSSPDNPANLAIEEAIPNGGLVGRDAKTGTPTDYAFVTRRGITTVAKIIQEKTLPLAEATPQVSDELQEAVRTATDTNIIMVFSQEENSAYLSTGERMFVFDFKIDQPRVLTWDFVPNGMHEYARVMYYGITNFIAQRDGYLDAVASDGTGGSTYIFDMESAWHDLSEAQVSNVLKILKRAATRVTGSSGQQFTYKWYLDFSDNVKSRVLTIPQSTVAEFGIAKYSVDEYVGSLPIFNVKSGMGRSGRVIKFGITAVVNGGEFSIRSLTLRFKLGKEVV